MKWIILFLTEVLEERVELMFITSWLYTKYSKRAEDDVNPPWRHVKGVA